MKSTHRLKELRSLVGSLQAQCQRLRADLTERKQSLSEVREKMALPVSLPEEVACQNAKQRAQKAEKQFYAARERVVELEGRILEVRRIRAELHAHQRLLLQALSDLGHVNRGEEAHTAGDCPPAR